MACQCSGITPGLSRMTFKGPLPQPLGAYELLEELGRGTTGIVYRAKSRVMDRILAMTFPTDRGSERALREVRTLAVLHSTPGVIVIYDAGFGDGHAYIAREHVDGYDLAVHLRTHYPSIAFAVASIASVARTVGMVNHRGIRHGNLSLENVLIPNSGLPKLIGFGSAQSLEQPVANAFSSDIRALGEMLVAAAELTGDVLPEFLEAITMK